MNVPIYRAKKIDVNEYVEGMLSPCGTKIFTFKIGFMNIEYGLKYLLCDYYMNFQIDPSTLEISFDNEESWNYIHDVKDAIKIADTLEEALKWTNMI